MRQVLAIDDLKAAYGGVEALHGISLTLAAGEIVTVIGPNGAGKTTLLNAVMGVVRAVGDVALDGRPLAGTSVESRLRRGLCLVPEKRELFSTMSVEDNLVLGAFSRRRREGSAARGRRLREVFGLFPRLAERRRQVAGTLSGGERQMLAIGRALMSEPRVLMLDEPSLGLAPLIVAEIFRIVTRLREGGTAILLVEQNARAALEISDRAIVLELGHAVLEGASAALARDPRVTHAYLGGSTGLEDA